MTLNPAADRQGSGHGATPSLGTAARSAVAWGVGFSLARDVIQFANMIVMVRLLSPADYGAVALAQSFIGLLSVISFSTFVAHALQARDPSTIDWQAHFTAGAVINVSLFVAALLAAVALSRIDRFAQAALPLAGLSLVFIIEVPAGLREKMLTAQHRWSRTTILALIGTLLGCIGGITVALAGGGYWALVCAVLMFGVPAAVDLLFVERWRPDWSWSWPRYRDTFSFGAARVGSGAVARGRQTVEQSLLAGVYDFATLGIFGRAIGLATLLVGRIGQMATLSLYPVITRAEPASAQFRRCANLFMQGVSWTSIPAAVFLGLAAMDATRLLYGSKWDAVIPLLPLAAFSVGLQGVVVAANSLLWAANEVRIGLLLDVVSAVSAVLVALAFAPIDIGIYLAALVAQAAFILAATLGILVRRNGIDRGAVVTALVVPMLAGAAAAAAVIAVRQLVASPHAVLRLAIDAIAFGTVYVAILRLFFQAALRDLIAVAPAGARLSRLLRLAPAAA